MGRAADKRRSSPWETGQSTPEPERRTACYVHWNGGRDTIEPLLAYCEMQGYRPPSQDCYGWARIAQVLGNFFGGALSVGIDSYDAGFGRVGMPYVVNYDHDGDFSWNPNSYVDGDTCRTRPRK